MITFGVTDALFSFISGRMEKLVGRVFLFSAAIVINICMLITMIFWFPGTEGQRFIFYLIPGLWGVADAVWQTTTSGEYMNLYTSKSLNVRIQIIPYFV